MYVSAPNVCSALGSINYPGTGVIDDYEPSLQPVYQSVFDLRRSFTSLCVWNYVIISQADGVASG